MSVQVDHFLEWAQKPWYKTDDKEWCLIGPYVVIYCASHKDSNSPQKLRWKQPIWIYKMLDQIKIPTLQINSKVSQINSKCRQLL